MKTGGINSVLFIIIVIIVVIDVIIIITLVCAVALLEALEMETSRSQGALALLSAPAVIFLCFPIQQELGPSQTRVLPLGQENSILHALLKICKFTLDEYIWQSDAVIILARAHSRNPVRDSSDTNLSRAFPPSTSN